jgi:hypothetical protein
MTDFHAIPNGTTSEFITSRKNASECRNNSYNRNHFAEKFTNPTPGLLDQIVVFWPC